MSVRSTGRGALRRFSGVIAVIVLVSAFVMLADRLFPPPLSKAADRAIIVLDRNDHWLNAFGTREGRWRFNAKLSKIDPTFRASLIAIEDKRFYHHPGVDVLALVRAAVSSARAGRIVSGGSTITMQTTRLLEPRPRTLRSKLIEIIRALQLESRLTKDEILALYLTLAPYGGNIEGVRAASLIYFGKEPAVLTPAETALFIALPQAPEARRPDRHAGAARAARDRIIAKLEDVGRLSAADAVAAVATPTPTARRHFPHTAYHAARATAFSGDAPSPPFAKSVDDVRSTIDARLQGAAQTIVRDHAMGFTDGANAAALIVEASTGEVLAYVGSAGFDRPGGWIDLTRAVRSPGSLLKPFVYGVAFDDGVLTPDTVMSDAPRAFDGYQPENFDRTYRGEVRVSEALQHSLNIPAVAALQAVGPQRFGATLKNAGAPLTLPQRGGGHAGLPTALGGAGLRLWDAARLYAGLADGGRVKPLTLKRFDSHANENSAFYQIMSPHSGEAILETLRDGPSLAGRAPAALAVNAPRVAFKTGTSYGYRDAWAAGAADGLVIAVWTGRADGAPRPGATGRKVAAPLLFALFDAALTQNGGAGVTAPMAEQNPRAFARRLDVREKTPSLRIAFPSDGAELFADSASRGFVLAAAGGEGPYHWYVDGKALRGSVEPAANVAVSADLWRPDNYGFHRLAVVDATGRSATASVRVHGPQ